MSNPTLNHLALIMDGNRRWAVRQGKRHQDGHEQGVGSVKSVVSYCLRHPEIKMLTLFAYSIENMLRPQTETAFIEQLLINALAHNIDELDKKGVKLRIIGDTASLKQKDREYIEACQKQTENNINLVLNICYRYSGRWHIVNVINRLDKHLPVTEADVSELMRQDLGEDPDLLIRTGGELRLSNFLLWSMAYTELYFLDCYWPEFTNQHLDQAIEQFKKRHRRYGKNQC